MADAPADEPKKIPPREVNGVIPSMGIAVGLVPFLMNGRETQRQTVSGTGDSAVIEHVTHKARFDRIAVPCAVVALVLGLIGVVRGAAARRYAVLALGLVAMAFGVIQAARGLAR